MGCSCPMNLEKIGPSTHCRGFSGHSMSDSAQVTSPGAINSMIAAMSTRSNRQNRSTLSRMSVSIALTPPPPCEPVHMRCAPIRRIRSHCAANPISPGQAGG